MLQNDKNGPSSKYFKNTIQIFNKIAVFEAIKGERQNQKRKNAASMTKKGKINIKRHKTNTEEIKEKKTNKSAAGNKKEKAKKKMMTNEKQKEMEESSLSL